MTNKSIEEFAGRLEAFCAKGPAALTGREALVAALHTALTGEWDAGRSNAAAPSPRYAEQLAAEFLTLMGRA